MEPFFEAMQYSCIEPSISFLMGTLSQTVHYRLFVISQKQTSKSRSVTYMNMCADTPRKLPVKAHLCVLPVHFEKLT